MSHEDMLENFEKASKALQKNATMSSGAAKIEAEYSRCYQVLVTAGVKPQIRKKYR